MKSKHVLCVVGARPNFMKIAPIMRAFEASGTRASLLHTGQHYDVAMNQSFFDQLGIRAPDVDLGVGSRSHAEQTAHIMLGFEPELLKLRPDAVLVVGDVNSTVACALVAVKHHIPVIHVEAGLRSFDRMMPEEVNRVLTDQISELLFTTEEHAKDNLAREGIDASRVKFVGNVMIDTLFYNLPHAKPSTETLASAGFALDKPYALVTLHRPSNVDDSQTLHRLIDVLLSLHKETPLVFPVHPRTMAKLREANLEQVLINAGAVLLGPQGYREMLGLSRDAAVVLTDSGGLQEETTALGVPCLTLRENTERPITVEQGTNTVVGTDVSAIRAAYDKIGSTGADRRQPLLWDGKAAERIVEHIELWFSNGNQ